MKLFLQKISKMNYLKSFFKYTHFFIDFFQKKYYYSLYRLKIYMTIIVIKKTCCLFMKRIFKDDYIVSKFVKTSNLPLRYENS